MSRENVELVRRALAAFGRGDVERVLDTVDDDLVTYRAHPEGASFHGREGWLRALEDWTQGFEDFSSTPEEFADAGDHVIVRVRQTARLRGSDMPLSEEWWFVYTISGGKIVRFAIYADRGAAFAAAGAGA